MTAKTLSGLLIPCLLVAPIQANCQQLEQERISIHGNRGLPKTLYIAPWKRIGEPLDGKQWESRISEPLTPLEQDLFLRQLEIRRQGSQER
jgi:hypothetical protein